MRFTFVDSLGIQINLNFLRPDSQPYHTFLYQHTGILTVNDVIGNALPVMGLLKAFFDTARENNADLVLTPEYCCPWQLISQTVNDPALWPRPGKLWVVGCESIKKEHLRSFQKAHSTTGTPVHFDTSVFEKDKDFLDPVVFLFIENNNDVKKLVILIQFKTSHMGVWTTAFERDHLIEGNDIYIFRNSPSSIQFFTLICSEAMNFPAAMIGEERDRLDWDNKSTLVFNPQCNPEPLHPNFIDFRRFLRANERKELITLNWGNTSKLGTDELIKHLSSRSSFSIRSHEINLEDNRIKNNHKNGMYYFSLKENKHLFVLNSNIAAYLIQNMPVQLSGGVNAQLRRDGPLVIKTYSYNDTGDQLAELTSSVNDGHIEYLTDLGCTCTFLKDQNTCILQKERLVTLTAGKLEKIFGPGWNNIENLFSIWSQETTELNSRITFTEDVYIQNVNQRAEYINAIRELEYNVLTHPELFPESIKDLKGQQLFVGYYDGAKDDGYKYNIITAAGASLKCYDLFHTAFIAAHTGKIIQLPAGNV